MFINREQIPKSQLLGVQQHFVEIYLSAKGWRCGDAGTGPKKQIIPQ